MQKTTGTAAEAKSFRTEKKFSLSLMRIQVPPGNLTENSLSIISTMQYVLTLTA
jgi:hypothetical protein